MNRKSSRDYFSNAKFRNKVIQLSEALSKAYQDVESENPVKYWNDILATVFDKNLKKNHKSFNTHFSKEEGTCLIGIVAISLLADFFIEQDPIDRSWSRSEGVNPNVVPFILLKNLSQHLLAVIETLKGGFDNSGRVLLRAAYENLWIFAVTLSDKERLSQYQTITEEEFEDFDRDRKIWKKYFAKKPLLEKFHEIEKKYYSQSENGESDRHALYSYYSLSTHSSYAMSLAMTAVGESKVVPKLHSAGLTKSLDHCSHIIYEAIFFGTRLLKEIHSPKASDWNLWQSYSATSLLFLGLHLADDDRTINAEKLAELLFDF